MFRQLLSFSTFKSKNQLASTLDSVVASLRPDFAIKPVGCLLRPQSKKYFVQFDTRLSTSIVNSKIYRFDTKLSTESQL